MFFEGSEKKLEVIIDRNAGSLRELGREKWDAVVEATGAQILNCISNEHMDAYLLSESSLFVSDDRFVLITCGRTMMVPAVKEFLKLIHLDKISALFFERKNEIFPQFQSTHFYQDAEELARLMPGKAYRFGEESGAHLFAFYLNQEYRELPQKECTVEILMHEFHPEVREIFLQGKEKIRSWIIENPSFSERFVNFQVDDHCFEPLGYSINAIKGEHYYTFHVTPEEKGSYVSFETNHCPEASLNDLSELIINLFKPKCWNVVATHSKDRKIEKHGSGELQSEIVQELKNGYVIHFSQFQKAEAQEKAVEVELPEFTPEEQGTLEKSAEPVEDWYYDVTQESCSVGFKIKKRLFSGKSAFQKVEVLETESHGKLLVNDDFAMISERDEFVYHEMMAHVPLFVHPHPRKVLIIGGGDCGTAREVLRHPGVEQVTMVEIDQMVVDACQEYFSWVPDVLSHPKFDLRIEDGVKYVAECTEQYDVVLVDSTDPIGPGAPLFGDSFYADVKNILGTGGIVVSQGECPTYFSEMQKKLHDILQGKFSKVYFYNYSNLSYPGGLWSFSFASDVFNPVEDFDAKKVVNSALKFQYYNPQVHCAAFFLPEFMRKNLGTKEL